MLEDSKTHRKDLAGALAKLADVLITERDKNTWESGKLLCDRSIKVSNGENPVAESLATLCLGTIAEALHNTDKAEKLFRAALTLSERGTGSHSPETGYALIWLANNLALQNKTAEAESLARKALAIFENSPDHRRKSESMDCMAYVLCRQGRFVEAETYGEQSAAEAARGFGDNSLTFASCLEELSFIQKYQGKDSQASANFAKALVIKADNQNEKQTYSFLQGAPNCEHHFKNGVPFLKIDANGLTAEVALIRYTDVWRVDLQISNNSGHAIDVLPRNVKILVEHQNFFNQFGPPNDPLLYRTELSQVNVDRFLKLALTPNTVVPGSHIAGVICFNPPVPNTPITMAAIRVMTANISFLFPLGADLPKDSARSVPSQSASTPAISKKDQQDSMVFNGAKIRSAVSVRWVA